MVKELFLIRFNKTIQRKLGRRMKKTMKGTNKDYSVLTGAG